MNTGRSCALRKRRKHPAIEQGVLMFADAVHDGNYRKATAIAVSTALEITGAEGMMNAVERANSFVRRRKARGVP